jgi:anti-anti-sigma factor
MVLLRPEWRATTFTVSVQPAGRRTRVRARAELDVATVPALARGWVEQARRRSPVVVDRREVSFIAASGLVLLVRLDADARHHGIEFQLIPSAPVVRLLKLCGVQARFADTGLPPE